MINKNSSTIDGIRHKTENQPKSTITTKVVKSSTEVTASHYCRDLFSKLFFVRVIFVSKLSTTELFFAWLIRHQKSLISRGQSSINESQNILCQMIWLRSYQLNVKNQIYFSFDWKVFFLNVRVTFSSSLFREKINDSSKTATNSWKSLVTTTSDLTGLDLWTEQT